MDKQEFGIYEASPCDSTSCYNRKLEEQTVMNDIPQLSTEPEELRKRFMDPCRLGSEIDWWARRRIEELERELETERCLSFRNQVAVVETERDALLADNERLRGALQFYASKLTHGDVAGIALATAPEQSLARIRNQIREECNDIMWASHHAGPEAVECQIFATKEPE